MTVLLILGAFVIIVSCGLTCYVTASVMAHSRERAERARADEARARAATHIGDWAYLQPSERRPHKRPRPVPEPQKPLPGTWEAPPNDAPGAAIPASEWPKVAPGGAYDG